MFDFLKRLFYQTNLVEELKVHQEANFPVDGDADEKSTEAIWNKIWSTALKNDERFNRIDSNILPDIEQRIRLGIIEGHGSRQAASELQPIFESMGLTIKDALDLVTNATNLVYQEKQTCLDANFILKEGAVETPEKFVTCARRKYVKKGKCFK